MLPTPLFDKIIVLRDPTETHAGALELSAAAQVLKVTGTILATGEGRLCPNSPSLPCLRQTLKVTDVDHEKLSITVESQKGEGFVKVTEFDQYERHRCHVEPLRVKVGDRVFFSPFTTCVFNHEGRELLIMSEDDVLLVLPPPVGGAPGAKE